MLRFLLSLFVGLVLGIGLGLYLGWVQFPLEFVNSPTSELAQQYRDDYTVMIASGFRADDDTLGAVERLRILGVDNVPEYVQEVTERYITNSREVDDIRVLVALVLALRGELTPLMEPYRQVTVPGQSP